MAKRELVPLGNRVLIQRSKPPTKTPGGIDIPDGLQSPDHEGIVLAVGPGMILNTGQRIECMVKVGDRVLLSTGNAFKFDNEEYVMVGEHEIPAIIKTTVEPPKEH